MKAKVIYFMSSMLYCLLKAEQKINKIFYLIIVTPIVKFLQFTIPEKWYTESMKNPNKTKQEYLNLINFANLEFTLIILLQFSIFYVPFIIAFNTFISGIIGIAIILFIFFYIDKNLPLKKHADIIRNFESKSKGWKIKRLFILILWIIESIISTLFAIFLGFLLESIWENAIL